MLNLRMAAYHEASHAVVNFLVGIHIVHLNVWSACPTEWYGECMPSSEVVHRKAACVATLAGMFGAQLGEGRHDLTIPNDLMDYWKYGAIGSDEPYARAIAEDLTMLNLKRIATEGKISSVLDVSVPGDQLVEKIDDLTQSFYSRMLEFARNLVTRNSNEVASLSELLIRQTGEIRRWPDPRVDKRLGPSMNLKELQGKEVEAFLAEQGLKFDSCGDEARAIPYIEILH